MPISHRRYQNMSRFADNKVYDIKRVSDRIILVKLSEEDAAVTVLSVCAPQTGLEESTKDFMTACKLPSLNYQIKK